MINIAEILQNFPKGTKLYSPLLGEIYLKFVSLDELIYVIAANGTTYDFNAVGKYYGDLGECLLFPSEDHREWDEDGIELLNKQSSVFMSREEAEAHSIKVSSQPHDYPEVFDKILEKLCEIQGKMGDIYAVVSKQPWWIYPYPQSPYPLDPYYKQKEWTVTCNENQNIPSNPADGSLTE